MRHLETDDARAKGYYVMGLPPRNVIKRDENNVPVQARLGGALSPEQSVQVSAGVLCHYYHHSHTMKGALEAYGGVRYTGTDVPAHVATSGDRLKIIEGWRDCEAYLKKEWRPKPEDKKPPNPLLPDYEADYPSFIKSALKKSRSFEVNNKEFDDILFPKNSVNEAGQRAWRPQRTPYWLMNAAMRGYR